MFSRTAVLLPAPPQLGGTVRLLKSLVTGEMARLSLQSCEDSLVTRHLHFTCAYAQLLECCRYHTRIIQQVVSTNALAWCGQLPYIVKSLASGFQHQRAF